MRKAPLIVLLVLALHPGCGPGPTDPGTQGLSHGGSGGSPLDGVHLSASPVHFDLGWVCRGGSVRAAIQIQNRGSAMGSADLSTDAPASVSPAQVTVPSGVTVAAGLVVRPGPTDPEHLSGNVRVDTPDGRQTLPWTARVTSDLRGKPAVLCGGTIPCTVLQLGSAPVGGEVYSTMVVANDGCSDFQVISLIPRLDDNRPADQLTPTTPAVPFTVPAGGSVTVNLAFDPTDVGVQTGNLLVQTNDPSYDEVKVPWSGIGQ